MEKMLKKVGPAVRDDPEFWNRINLCVWGSETPAEFESHWTSIISEFGLEGNK